MAGFLFRLEIEDGKPADPPTHTNAVPNWRPERHDPRSGRTLRVVDVRE
jgi:hypothetical protein